MAQKRPLYNPNSIFEHAKRTRRDLEREGHYLPFDPQLSCINECLFTVQRSITSFKMHLQSLQDLEAKVFMWRDSCLKASRTGGDIVATQLQDFGDENSLEEPSPLTQMSQYGHMSGEEGEEDDDEFEDTDEIVIPLNAPVTSDDAPKDGTPVQRPNVQQAEAQTLIDLCDDLQDRATEIIRTRMQPKRLGTMTKTCTFCGTKREFGFQIPCKEKNEEGKYCLNAYCERCFDEVNKDKPKNGYYTSSFKCNSHRFN